MGMGMGMGMGVGIPHSCVFKMLRIKQTTQKCTRKPELFCPPPPPPPDAAAHARGVEAQT